MALYDSADFLNRLKFLAGGRRWAGPQAWNDGTDGNPVGRLYALMFSVAVKLAEQMANWAYVRLQTRLASITDQYVDLAWQDYYRGRDGRRIGESDATSSARLRAQLVAPTGTHNAVLAAVQTYYADNPDERITSIDVFDRQTDPNRSTYYGIRDAQFAVILYAPELGGDAWFLGQSFIGQSTFAQSSFAYTLSETAPSEGLATAVGGVKDLGYRPIFILSRGEPANYTDWGSDWGQMIFPAS